MCAQRSRRGIVTFSAVRDAFDRAQTYYIRFKSESSVTARFRVRRNQRYGTFMNRQQECERRRIELSITSEFDRTFIDVYNHRERTILFVCGSITLFIAFMRDLNVSFARFIAQTYACISQRIEITVRMSMICAIDRFLCIQCILNRVSVRVRERIFRLCQYEMSRRFRAFINSRANVSPFASAPKDDNKRFRSLILHTTVVVNGIGSRAIIRRLRVRAYFMEEESFQFRLIIRFRIQFT